MHPRKHARMIIAILSVLLVAIAVALHAWAPTNVPTQSTGQPSPAESSEQPSDPPAPNATANEPAASTGAVERNAEPTHTNDPAASTASSDAPANAPTADADAALASEELQRQASAMIEHAEQPKVAPDAEYEPGVVLVSVREGTTAAQFSQAVTEAGIKCVEPSGVEVVTDGLVMARLAPNATIDDAIHELESTGIAKGAQPNYVYEISENFDEPSLTVESNPTEELPDTQSTMDVQSTSPATAREALNDTLANKQWNLDSIDLLEAWELPSLKNASATVGVGILDNGFNDSHEDLADNVRSTYNATTKVENVPVPCPPGTPDANHGSHVAGIVAATSNNEKGISGVGFNHLKLSLVCLTSESEPNGVTTADVVTGFEYLIKHKDQYNIRVANISLGAKVSSLPSDDAILKKVDEAFGAGIVTVASAGNETYTAVPPYINYPSDYETVISVMNLLNTDANDPKAVSLSSKSNFNAPNENSKNISAPGTDIWSTLPSDYGNMSGTSMAAPHVAGVVGLMFAANPSLSAQQAKDLLYSSARDIGDAGWDCTYGYGEVNALAAVRAAVKGTISGPGYLAIESTATYTVSPSSEGWSFSSSNPNVLAIDADGKAQAVSAGTVDVSATNGASTITQQVMVFGPITGTSLVAKGGSESLSIAKPDGCGDLAWNWGSGDESVATVTDKGMVRGQNVGSTTITATLVSDSSVVLSHTITVYDANKGNVYVPVEGTTTLSPDVPTGTTITWSSSNEQVATVDHDQKGQVTAQRAGGAAVSCTFEQGSESTTYVWLVYVYGPIEGAARIGVGQTAQLEVTGIGNTTQDLQTGWTWSLGNGSSSEVATVNESGFVTARKPGTVTVTATRGSGQDQASFSHNVEVTQNTLANAKVTIPKQTYSGKELTPVPEVTLNGTELVAGTDYEVAHQDIVNVGSYTITITGKGAYAGKASGDFVVEPMRLTPPKPATGLVYNGSEQTGVSVSEGDKYTLTGDVTKTDADDYLAFAEVKDTTNTCWKNNSTSCRIEWSIKPRSIAEASIAGLESCVYDGKEQKPKPTVTWNGMTLSEEKDYTVSYANNKNAGDATITITATDDNYTGSKKATFTIAPAPYSVGIVSAKDVKESLDPTDVVLMRTNTGLPGRLAITEPKLTYGTNTYHWSFTPDDANYAPSSGTVKVTVTGSEQNKDATPKAQPKEDALPKSTDPKRLSTSVVVRGDGPSVEMSVPDELLESMLTSAEKALVEDGADASLIATVTWLSDTDVPAADVALLAKDCENSKTSLGWETHLDVTLHILVGNQERVVTKVDKPITFTVGIDPEGKDAVCGGLARAIADGKADGSVTVRRVHGNAVDKVGFAKRGETVSFRSDRFSTYALGSAATGGSVTAEKGGTTMSSSTAASSTSAKTTATSTSATSASATRLAATADDTQSALPPLVAALVDLGLALRRQRHEG